MRKRPACAAHLHQEVFEAPAPQTPRRTLPASGAIVVSDSPSAIESPTNTSPHRRMTGKQVYEDLPAANAPSKSKIDILVLVPSKAAFTISIYNLRPSS